MQNNHHGTSILLSHLLGACVAFEMPKIIKRETGFYAKVLVIDGRPILHGASEGQVPEASMVQSLETEFEQLATQQANINYQAKRNDKVEGILVIQAELSNLNLKKEWQELSRNEIYSYQIAGDRNSILKKPSVAGIGEIINHYVTLR